MPRAEVADITGRAVSPARRSLARSLFHSPFFPVAPAVGGRGGTGESRDELSRLEVSLPFEEDTAAAARV